MNKLTKSALCGATVLALISCSDDAEKIETAPAAIIQEAPKLSIIVSGLNGVTKMNLDGKYYDISDNGEQVLDEQLVMDMEYYLFASEQPQDQYCSVQNRAGIVSGDVSIRVNCSGDKISQLNIQDQQLKACITDYALAKRWRYTTEMFGLKCNDMGIKSIEGISALTELTSLNLKGNEITEAIMTKSEMLQTLDLASNKLEKIDISKLSKLEVLGLADNQLSEITFGDQKTLKNISVRNNKLSSVAGLENVSSIAWLDLGENQIKDIQLTDEQVQTLVRLDLSGNPLSASSRAALSQIKDEMGLEINL